MDRRDYYYLQLLTEAELDDGFEQAELADFAMMADNGLIGAVQDLAVTENSPTPDLTVDVADGVAYDSTGQRIAVPSPQSVDVSEDYLGSPTDVVGGSGFSKIVSLFVYFDRSLSDPRIDGNSNTVYFERNETYSFKVVQGSESSGTPTPPALEADKILLADITFADTGGGTPTQIFDADIALDGRRQDAFVLSAGSLDVRAGTAEESDQALLTHLNNHVTGTGNLHPASSIDYAGGPNWENGDTNPATDMESQIDSMITRLAAKASLADCGANRVGACATTNTYNDGGVLAAASIADQLNWLVGDIGDETSAAACGARRVGAGAYTGSGPDNPLALLQGSVMEQLQQIVDKLNPYDAANSWTASNTFDGRADFNAQAWINSTPLYLNGTARLDLSNTTAGNVFGFLKYTPTSNGGINFEQRGGTGSFLGNSLVFSAQQGQDASGVQGNRGGHVFLNAGVGGNGTSYGDNGYVQLGFGTDATVNTYYRHHGSGEKNYATPGPTDILTVPMISTETWAVEVTMCAQDTGGAEKVQRRSAMIDRDGSLVTITGDTLDKDVGTGDAAMTLATVSSVGFKVQVAGASLTGNCAVFVRAYIVTT